MPSYITILQLRQALQAAAEFVATARCVVQTELQAWHTSVTYTIRHHVPHTKTKRYVDFLPARIIRHAANMTSTQQSEIQQILASPAMQDIISKIRAIVPNSRVCMMINDGTAPVNPYTKHRRN